MKTLCGGLTITLVVLLCPAEAPAQSVRSLVNGGNDLYKEQKYTDAEVNYRKALEKEKGQPQATYDLGNALYKQSKPAEAAKEYETALHATEDTRMQSQSYFNIGNTFAQGQDYQNAIKGYINALKLNPDDADAKYNLSYALRMLKQQQQQQQNKNNDKKQDQKNQQDQKKQNQQQQQQNKQDQQRQQPQPRQQERQISKAEAERILAVLKNNERDVQKKLRTRTAVRPRSEKDW
jgi:Ca-activated chloride channel family protein